MLTIDRLLRERAAERRPAPILPMSRAEMDALGWDAPDVVFVTGDAYVDHPSFAMALLGRVLEAAGYRVAILSQPDWRSAEPWRALGRPRLFYAVSAGNMDSMINHYTANKKPRSDDAYSPGGRMGLRPDRPTAVYAQRCREASPGVPVVIGGVEASLRRLAHYDYWSDTVRPSMLLSSKADLLVYGMGERPIVEIAERLCRGASILDCRGLRGVCHLLGARSEPPGDAIRIPSFEEVASDKVRFAVATRHIHQETNPFNARRLLQAHGAQHVVQNAPQLPLSQAEMDAIYDLPYTRRPHPSYQEPIPAHAMIKDSVTIMRGCFGGCTFCSITTHQGRIIQSRSKASVVREIRALGSSPEFKGTVSDIGGPTANMYEMRCTRPEVEAVCRRLSCVHPTVCKLLGTEHGPLIDLMREARSQPGVKRVLVSSGVRMDLAQKSRAYLEELTKHHVGGHLKVAPEHASDRVLEKMKKPSVADFVQFGKRFREASRKAGKDQYLVPYFIASHPGSMVEDMIDLALFLKRNGYKPRQAQDFIPAPLDVATCMYHTGLDPMTMKEVPVVKALRDRRMQRALMQFWKPENYFLVREALLKAGRKDLIGDGCDALIPAKPPNEAIEARRKAASEAAFIHEIPSPRAAGYRPGRAGWRPARRGASTDRAAGADR
jgi:uncharacterized radical SAM protein YgiQ